MNNRLVLILKKVEGATRLPFVGLFVAFVICAIVTVILKASIQSSNNNGGDVVKFEMPSVAELYPQALTKAQEWHEDAYMASAKIGVRVSATWATFFFDSLNNPNEGLLVTFWLLEHGYEIEVENVDAPGRLEADPPINREDWDVDSIEAARIAFDNRGKEFLYEHPEADRAMLQLTRVSGSAAENTGLEMNRIVWVMHYYQLRGVELRVFVDPITGEIIGEQFFEADNFDPDIDNELEVDTF